MTKKFRITATAPTVYQLISLRAFNLPVSEVAGSYIGEEFFETKEDAKAYLIDRAQLYYEDADELNDSLEDIEKYNQLTLDAVTARIAETENDEQ